MRTKTQTAAFTVCIAVLSMQFIACKKEIAKSTAVTTSSTEQVIARPNLAAWYKFTNGNTADYSGNNNHLKGHHVKLAADMMGRPNNAYAFNGFSSFMEAANSSSLNPSTITIAALVQPVGFYGGNGAQSRILMKGVDDQSNGDYFIGFHNTGSIFGTYGDNQFQSNGVATSDNFLQLNQWYKIVYTYDGAVGKLYLNDSLVGENTKVAAFNPNTDRLRIGKTGRTDYPFWFNGVIDEIRIYNIALTKNQVTKLDAEIGQ